MASVRFSWNVWPPSGLESKRLPVPISCLVTPLYVTPSIPEDPATATTAHVSREPLLCRGGCNAILNPFCSVDSERKSWRCCFCHTDNALPIDFTGEEVRCHTIDYALPRDTPQTAAFGARGPTYLFALDTSVSETELSALKDAVEDAVGLLPENASVALMTFGVDVCVYDLSASRVSPPSDAPSSNCPISYVFSGHRDVSPAKVASLLGCSVPAAEGSLLPQPSASGFVSPVSECEFAISGVLEGIKPDSHYVGPSPSDRRPECAVGVAVAVACGLLESACKGKSAKAMFFVGSPCTVGPGTVADALKKQPMRSHHDIATGKAHLLARATSHYDFLASRFVDNGHSVDLFCCSLDQTGLHEMQSLSRRTCGLEFLGESFTGELFRSTLLRMLERHVGFISTFEVVVTKELRVAGVVGNVSPIVGDRTALASDSAIGFGGTTAWRLCTIDPSTTLNVFFDVVIPHGRSPLGPVGVVQFLTHYHTVAGKQVLRVITVARNWASGPSADLMVDQEVVAVSLARHSVLRTEQEDPLDVLRWIDRVLIKLVARTAVYRRDDLASFQLPPSMARLPRFIYHLRRSNFLQFFNISPDETAHIRHSLLRETLLGGMTMIQPTLLKYSITAPADPVEVPLSANSVSDDSVLLLDTFFFVLVLLGHQVALKKKAGEDSLPGNEALSVITTQPVKDAMAIVSTRFPSTRYIECTQYSGNARFLLSLLDPEMDASSSIDVSQFMPTEDVSFNVFMNYLKRTVVEQY